jgi:hypothetical protein
MAASKQSSPTSTPFGEVVATDRESWPALVELVRCADPGRTFGGARETLRYLYLQEWMHGYLQEHLGRNSGTR